MKVKVNIRQFIEDNAHDPHMMPVAAHIDIDDLFEANDIPEERELDIYELLEEEHAIALIWTAEVVRSHHPRLSEEQAWELLKACEMTYSAEEGLTWDDIAEAVTELYPEPEDLLPEPVIRCQQALQGYVAEDETTNLTDLIADAMAWCRSKGHSFETSLETARVRFTHETPSE